MGVIINLERRRTQTQGMAASPQPAITNWILDAGLGSLIRATRQKRHWTLDQLVARGVYMDPKSLSHIERGEKAVEYRVVRQIAQVLHEPRIANYASELIIAQLDPVQVAEGVVQ